MVDGPISLRRVEDGSRDGTLEVLVAGARAERLTTLFSGLLLTVTPNYRRNFLRLAVRYANARAQDGVDPATLFADGMSGFRADLSRWHSNESGRFAWDWDGTRITVFIGDQVEEDVTEALRLVLDGHLPSARRKYLGFLLSYINEKLEAGEDHTAFMTDVKERVRQRVEQWLRDDLELKINFVNGQPDSSVDVRSDDGPIDHRALGIAAVRQLYEVLGKALRVRNGENPLDIDGLAAMSLSEKRQLAFDKYGKYDRLPKHFGAQYAVTGRTDYAPIPHDPTVAYQVLRAAADECDGYPDALKNLLEIMDGEGPRHHDMKDKCFDAWAASDFGEWMWAGNKGQADPEAKRVVFGPECGAGIATRVDADHASNLDSPATLLDLARRALAGEPVRPSMAQLRQLKAEGRMDVLARIPMFPSSLGTPYGYGGWNYWIRKSTDGADDGKGALIATSLGLVRPTAVWLRRSMFTEKVTHLASRTKDRKALKAGLTVIRTDAGHRSDGPIYRYAHSVLPAIFAEGQDVRSAEHRERLAAVRAGRPIPVAQSDTPQLSDASEARRGRARP